MKNGPKKKMFGNFQLTSLKFFPSLEFNLIAPHLFDDFVQLF